MRNEPSDFAVHVEHGGATVIVRPVGEMDITSQTQWHAAVAAATGRPYRELVIDMAEVSFMDVSGLNCLIATAHQLRDAGIEVSVANASRQVERVCALSEAFDTTGGIARQERT